MSAEDFTLSVRAAAAAWIEFLTLKIPQQRKKVKREKMNNKKRLHSGAGAKAG